MAVSGMATRNQHNSHIPVFDHGETSVAMNTTSKSFSAISKPADGAITGALTSTAFTRDTLDLALKIAG
jgi:hypothetical protein